MRSQKNFVLLALLFSVLMFGQAQAKNVYIVKDQYGIPFTKNYIAGQRAQSMKRVQQSNTAGRDVYISLPSNVSGYYNWEISFVDGGGSPVYTFTTNSSTNTSTPLGNVAEGTYDLHFTCFDYYSQGWDLQYYWFTTQDNTSTQRYVHTINGNAYYNSVIVYGAVVNDDYFSPYIQIDGGY